MNCGLLGRKLGHSYSPQIHAMLGDYTYTLFEKEPEEVEDFLRSGPFTGLNVTIPYKKTVLPFCDVLSPRARALGAVNTIVRREDGSLVGHNTDYFGFASLVRKAGLDPAGKKALVLGSGGASNTAVAVLKAMGAQVVVISRSGENHYGNLDRHADASLLVNATPVGMYPHPGVSPVDLGRFPRLEGVLDMIYNPCRTRLLMDAAQRGLTCANGLWMLVAQAKESAEWFTGQPISDDRIAPIHAALRREMENMILIGMPGSGKTTVARLLAAATGRPVVDADEEIEKAAGMSIPAYFAAYGEDAFRKLETSVLAKHAMRSGLILATGGGCVTRPENDDLLHQNGTVFCLNRRPEALPTDGRPLSQKTDPVRLYEIRKPMYRRAADVFIDNNGTPEDSVRQILKHWEEET